MQAFPRGLSQVDPSSDPSTLLCLHTQLKLKRQTQTQTQTWSLFKFAFDSLRWRLALSVLPLQPWLSTDGGGGCACEGGPVKLPNVAWYSTFGFVFGVCA